MDKFRFIDKYAIIYFAYKVINNKKDNKVV